MVNHHSKHCDLGSPFLPPAFDQSFSAELIHALPETLRRHQEIFDSTGGLHASALFSSRGELQLLREDVGRHNALDKIVGHHFLTQNLPLSKSVLLVSGRASFELIQKASMAGISVFAAVGSTVKLRPSPWPKNQT